MSTVNIALIDPAYPHNVGQTVRIASNFGVDKLLMTGTRVKLVGQGKKYRLPREERYRDYMPITPTERPFDESPGLVPVCIEIVPNTEDLIFFEHPENAVYVFGPEDGEVPPGIRSKCHRFVQIPGLHCFNLATAVGIVLYDRYRQQVLTGEVAYEDRLSCVPRFGT